mgnify:CR=1 FL=1
MFVSVVNVLSRSKRSWSLYSSTVYVVSVPPVPTTDVQLRSALLKLMLLAPEFTVAIAQLVPSTVSAAP